MNNQIIAMVGEQQANLYIKRPRWSDIQNSYKDIGILNAYLSYKKVGGYAYQLHVENPNDYANACALRMSWAFNHGGYKIPSGTIFSGRNIYRVKGKDERPYILRVEDMIFFIENKWGEPEIDNIKFLDISRKLLGRKGIIIYTISGWDDASGHVTLWNGNGVEDESNYHNDDYYESKISNIQFWELK
ncbi:type VI secretion system amidase effector protein Tae4 [Aliivibrio fischeri]|uniref:type VI secretion system amidase effector protein Tae4 n=1 Tax=Aliivibrio fischeri TaxID=668 RepID=UPI0018C72478|nr:type VI secretion system amidase effector protein Tae4 [Aliivibrio fischeri]